VKDTVYHHNIVGHLFVACRLLRDGLELEYIQRRRPSIRVPEHREQAQDTIVTGVYDGETLFYTYLWPGWEDVRNWTNETQVGVFEVYKIAGLFRSFNDLFGGGVGGIYGFLHGSRSALLGKFLFTATAVPVLNVSV